jgi:hypothetical protein
MEVGGEADSGRVRDPRAMSTGNFEDQTFGALPAYERVELAEREFDGISVALYWTRGTDVLAVAVEDAVSGESFELVVAESESPLDIFHHPFAHARARGIELREDRRRAGVALDV